MADDLAVAAGERAGRAGRQPAGRPAGVADQRDRRWPMSNGYALAAVTAVLRSRLNQRLASPDLSGTVGTVTVSALPPDRITVGTTEAAQLNLFLYQVTPNLAWRNVGLPSTDPAGNPAGAPPLGLDLHYLLTAYGPDMYVGEIILGHALLALHDEPVLGREVIRAALDPAVPDPNLPPALGQSGLADQVEQIRLSQTVMPPEELSKLWSALQAHYRPTASYEARVVLIDSQRTRRSALPVSGTGVAGLAQLPPVLDAVAEATGPGTPITATSTIQLRGRGLNLAGPVVSLDGHDVPAIGPVTPSTIKVDLAAAGLPLRAGLVAVQVRGTVALGDPPADHQAYPSNSLPFQLVPTITASVTVTSTEPGPDGPLAAGHVDVTVDPPVTARQRVSLLLNELGAPPDRRARGYALPAPDGNGVPDGATDTASISFPFIRIPTGGYLVRLSVDGAESPLAKDGTGRYALPAVTL
jgi:hypothetical protein